MAPQSSPLPSAARRQDSQKQPPWVIPTRRWISLEANGTLPAPSPRRAARPGLKPRTQVIT